MNFKTAKQAATVCAASVIFSTASAATFDFVAMAEGMGVRASRATTADEFNEQFEKAMREKGPRLIDAHVPSLSG